MYAGLGQSEASPPPLSPWAQALQAFFTTPAGQQVQTDVAAVTAPLIQRSAQQAGQTWWQQNQTKVLIGAGVAVVALVLLTGRR